VKIPRPRVPRPRVPVFLVLAAPCSSSSRLRVPRPRGSVFLVLAAPCSSSSRLRPRTHCPAGSACPPPAADNNTRLEWQNDRRRAKTQSFTTAGPALCVFAPSREHFFFVLPDMNPSIQPLGDSAAIITWPDALDDQIPDLIQQLAMAIRSCQTRGLAGNVPAFASLTLHYDPTRLLWHEVLELIQNSLLSMTSELRQSARLVAIPVCYDAEFALDLSEVAALHGMTVDEVVRLHSGADYTVRMIGFSPGFPYLAGLPEQLATPRRSNPRLNVPAGSVAIGGRQTGIYSLETPGGWQIIGRTPARLFRPEHDPPCLLSAGDRVRFVPISRSDFSNQQDLF